MGQRQLPNIGGRCDKSLFFSKLSIQHQPGFLSPIPLCQLFEHCVRFAPDCFSRIKVSFRKEVFCIPSSLGQEGVGTSNIYNFSTVCASICINSDQVSVPVLPSPYNKPNFKACAFWSKSHAGVAQAFALAHCYWQGEREVALLLSDRRAQPQNMFTCTATLWGWILNNIWNAVGATIYLHNAPRKKGLLLPQVGIMNT